MLKRYLSCIRILVAAIFMGTVVTVSFMRFGLLITSALVLLLFVALILYEYHSHALLKAKEELEDKNQELNRAIGELKKTHDQLIRSEKLAVENLQVSIANEMKFRSIIESTNDAFISMDHNGNIIDWNQSAERIFGWNRAEVLSKAMAEVIIPAQYRQEQDMPFSRLSDVGEHSVIGKTMELSALHKDGRGIPIEITIWSVAINQDHQFNAFIRDITARKRLENDLKKRNQELIGREKEALQALKYIEKSLEEKKQTQMQLLQSEKMASVGQLAAGIAHEINNPVGFISNNLEMLQQYISEYTKILGMVSDLKAALAQENLDKAKSASQQIDQFEQEMNLEFVIQDIDKLMQHNQKGIERIKKIVMDLRTFAREDKGSMDLVKIEDVMDSILSIVHNEMKYKAELVKQYGQTPLIKCNSQRIGQVFINMLINATHAIEEKGAISVKTYSQDHYVCVDISDTGKGIEEKNLPKIFDAFFTTKPVGQGTGLGLSISYEIIKKHEGKIAVKSKVGEGTTFTVMLPMPKEAGGSL